MIKNNTNLYKDTSFNENFIMNNEDLYNETHNVEFINVVFEKNAIFDNICFEKNITFKNCKFKGEVSFKSCIFYGEVIFKNVKFNDYLTSKKVFMNSRLYGQKILFENIKNIPRLDGFIFSQCSKVLLKNIDYKKADYENAKINYRIAKNQCNTTGNYEMVSSYYYKERYYGGKGLKKEEFTSDYQYFKTKFLDFLSRVIFGYGERPINVFLISFIIISIFAIFYFVVGVKNNGVLVKINYVKNKNELFKYYIDLWYFSMITFSTVGYGDITVVSDFGKILVSIEVFLGVTMGATWASVIFRKMSR